jgi:hypothetical protein
MNGAVTRRHKLFVSGQPVELWENPDHPFGWMPRDIQGYIDLGDWLAAFNALMLTAGPQFGALGS